MVIAIGHKKEVCKNVHQCRKKADVIRPLFGRSIAPSDSSVPKKGLFITQKVVLICIFCFYNLFYNSSETTYCGLQIAKRCKTEIKYKAAVFH